MKCDINWEREDFWNELYKCDEYFLSFHFDHCAFDEDKWKELIEKWKLNIKTTIGDSRYDPESEDATAYNDDYTAVISGIGNDGIPGYYLILTFSELLPPKGWSFYLRIERKRSLAYLGDQKVNEN